MARSILVVVLSLLLAASPAMPAWSSEFSDPAFAPTGVQTSVPVGHAVFCQTRHTECGPNPELVASVSLDQPLWTQLLTINARVNSEVRPVADEELYQKAEFWAYPEGAGDCEDYVLAKRRALAAAGWPLSAMLIAVVKQASGAGHAVLMVRTDRGDLVLDNQAGEVKLWNQTPYFYVKRQSQANAGQWVDIMDGRSLLVAGDGQFTVGSTP